MILLLRKTLAALARDASSLAEISNDLEKFIELAKKNLDLIDNYSTIKKAMKLFTQNPSKNTLKPKDVILQEALITKKLDEKILKLQNNLTSTDWIDLINTKSILRHRNQNLLESCVYNLTKLDDENALTIGAIQSLFLSCGVLKVYNVQFLKFLLNKFLKILKTNESNVDWVKENEKNLNLIINSIGILRLKDSETLDALCALLNKNPSFGHKSTINFVKSAASLNYKPPGDDFIQLLEKINVNSFNLTEIKEQVLFLDFVWSLCVLRVQNPKLVATVLSVKFWNNLITS